MKLDELHQICQFHDCDIDLPIETNNGDLTVTFLLAEHLQSEKSMKQYAGFFRRIDKDLSVRIKFLGCSELRAIERKYKNRKEVFKKNGKYTEKAVNIEEIDEVFPLVVEISDEKGFSSVLEGREERYVYLSFRAESAEFLVSDD